MGRWVWFDNGDQYKFWFGTQSSEDITLLGGETEKVEWEDDDGEMFVNEEMIAVHWSRERDLDNLKEIIKVLKAELKEQNGLTYKQAMGKQEDWSHSKGNVNWRLVARLNLAHVILKHLKDREDVYCEAEYY